MNRRDFLKSLAGVPLLGFLKPVDKSKQAQFELIEVIRKIEPGGKPFFDIVETTGPISQNLTQWNGLAFGPGNTIYAGGAFVNPSVFNDEYWARWNGQDWEEIEL